MNAANIDTAHLVGNSLGGWIALELARRGRARSVVAISPAGGWRHQSRAEARVARMFTRAHRLGIHLLPHLDRLMARPRMRRALLAAGMTRGDRLTPHAAAQVVRDSIRCPVYMELLEAIVEDGPPSLDGIAAPVLIAWGSSDWIIPARRYSQRFRTLLPAAEWAELPGVGHTPMADNPTLIARTIVDFSQRNVLS
jgi:pimeloyl-ACP methyl ester carboxylesterase